jgi:hypothetical protein
VSQGLDALLQQNGLKHHVKLELFILGRNKILMRVANIGDAFNTNNIVVPHSVDIQGLADGLYRLVNGDSSSATAEITELSISGNMPYSEMAATKIQWATVDDHEGLSAFDEMNLGSDATQLQ